MNPNTYFSVKYKDSPDLETVFMVININSTTTHSVLLGGIYEGSRNLLLNRYSAYNPGYLYLTAFKKTGGGGDINLITNDTPGARSIQTNTSVLISYVYNYYTGSYYQYINGYSAGSNTTEISSNSFTSKNNVTILSSPSDYNFVGTFQEIIIYNNVLTNADRTAIQNDLMTKWNISGFTGPTGPTGPPKIDCVVKYPETWGPCDVDTGYRYATGVVITPAQNGGKSCPPLTVSQKCPE